MVVHDDLKIFNFKVFISYKSQQESWARRLAYTLREFGLTIWRDHDADEGGIRLGESWSDEIKRGIRDSEKMLVLWSELIANNASTVVHQEIQEMHAYIENDTSGKRGYIPISLDGHSFASYAPLSAYQGDQLSFSHLHDKYGDEGADNVPRTEWYEAIKSLIEVLGLEDVMEIRFIVAAMTYKQACELRDNPTVRVNENTYTSLKKIMQKTSGFDPSRYGNTPDDWKPFPQLEDSWTVREIIEAYDKEKRDWLHNQSEFSKWIIVSYSAEIVSNDENTRREAKLLLNDAPCLVIVDPVSLMHRDVFNQIIVDGGMQHHNKAYFIGIAPFISVMHEEMYNQAFEVWENLQKQGFLNAAYEKFQSIFEPNDRAFIMDIENQYQFMRWLQVANDSIVSSKQTPMQSNRLRRKMHPLRRKSFSPQKPPTSDIVRLAPQGGK